MKRLSLAGALALAAVYSAASTLSGAAATTAAARASLSLSVTKTADTNDGTCDADCSLREAVVAANANPGPDAITLSSGVYAFSLGAAEPDSAATGDLDLTDDVVIAGAGPDQSIVDASFLDRVFDITAGVRVAMSGLTVRRGQRPNVFWSGRGAGIRSSGELELTRVRIANNSTPLDIGGGIASDGTLTLTDVAVADNEAFAGGGIRSSGTATLTRVTVSGNRGVEGPAGIENRGTMTVSNSTVSDNRTSFESGGGVSSDGSLALRNVTISNNRATGGTTSALYVDAGSEASVANTILDGPCDRGSQPTSLGHNLERGDTCVLRAAGDVTNLDPMLAALADNGGQSQTHALLPGSPAIDAGDGGSCPATDQRGVARPQGAQCDIGAYEAPPAPPPLPTLSIDDVTLPEGNSGTTDAVLTVRLSAPATEPVSVGVATSDDTATAGSDYAATQTTLNFPIGETARDVRVPVSGDTVVEPDERFLVNLSNATGATIADGQGQATIVNDDQAPPQADLELTASLQTAAPLVSGEPVKLAVTVENNGPQQAMLPVLRYAFVDSSGTAQPRSVIDVVSIEPALSCGDAGSNTTECELPPAPTGGGTQLLLTVVAHRAGLYAAYLDVRNLGSEGDPDGTNNSRQLALDVQPRTADLELTASLQTAAPLVSGEPVKLAVTVKNNGPQQAMLPVLRYAFVDSTLASQPRSVIDVVSIEPAATCADAGSNMTECGLPPAPSGGGTQLLVTVVAHRAGQYAAVLEALSRGAESDPNGNNNRRDLLLDVQPARPDLMPVALTLPDPLAVGNGAVLSWTLRNAGGPLAAASFNDRFYLSEDPWLDPADRLVAARFDSDGMAAGSERTVLVDLFVPGDVAFGSYYVIGVADHGNAIQESDEQNNTRAVAVAVAAERVEDTLPSGGSLTTDAEADGATSTDPIEVTIWTPTGGFASIDEGPSGATDPANFQVLGSPVRIAAPAATSQQPLRISFVVDGSLLPTDGSVVQVLRNGTLVSDCSSPGVAAPDPCVESRGPAFGDDLAIVVLTSAASDWVLGVPRDAAPPQVVVPADFAVDATSPAGATVAYSASASDDADPNPILNCSPTSGSVFAIGPTTVSCTATDWVGKTSSGSFVVTVRGAPEQIVALVQKTLAMLNHPGLEAALQAQLEQAATTLIAGNKPAACRLLTVYIAVVRLQSGRALTTAQAAELVADAQRIKAVIGC